MNFHLEKLLRDVFAPSPDERVAVLVDLPHGQWPDEDDWRERRKMAEEWRAAFGKMGLRTFPMTTYPCTGAGNADLPEFGTQEGKPVRIAELMAQTNICISMTRYSATAPLIAFARKIPTLRAASMPNVLRRMEQSALAADYSDVARKAAILEERLRRAESADVVFSTEHRFTFDLRHRTALSDDGRCRTDREMHRVINLPSGEAFVVPYEGEREGDPSRTAGQIPIHWKGQSAVLRVAGNRITGVEGDEDYARKLREHFDVDPARRNIAELGLGCNDAAIVTGNVLEDEKAGFHWAYGRSEHLGGVTGPDKFSSPANVVHNDIVYAKGCPVGVKSLVLNYKAGGSEEIMRDSAYTVF